jgi:MoaA/NifB/PqqE/SkfB family radical SAM enzyme
VVTSKGPRSTAVQATSLTGSLQRNASQYSLSKEKERRSSQLDTLCVELTVKCPLRCIHCSANAAPERNLFQEVERLSACIEELGSLTEIYLSGGEPLEHPDIERIVEMASGVAPVVVAYSSGTLLCDGGITSISLSMLERLKAKGLARVDLSIYAANAELHDSVTNTIGSFEATLLTARHIRESNLTLGIHFVPLGPASEQVIEVGELSRQLGAQRFHVLALAGQGRARQRLDRLSPTQHFWHLMAALSSLPDSSHDLILSSEIRRRLGTQRRTQRDTMRTAFLDVRGYLYPGEGQQSPHTRSASSIYDGVSLLSLVQEVTQRHA